ncbi:ion channel protein [Rhodococcus xishaensis]|uniref:ion channel protein n=1 Tax=Rhodococcus xishaensis TaxID=2487364 RepID=UPI001F4706DA|nr:ion channel protein [Rhodococcus xishaensis]
MDGIDHPPTRVIARDAALALVLGLGSAVVPLFVFLAVRGVTDVLYVRVPEALGFAPDSRAWIFGVLTVSGIAVGSVVWLVPGHGGRDSATVGLIGPPPPLRVLPSLLLVLILALGAGVSLSPENVLISANSALAVWIFARVRPDLASERIIALSTAATIGVQFGTPVAAPLVYHELTGRPVRGNLWDALFAPFVAAGVGTLVMQVLVRRTLSVDLPRHSWPSLGDVLGATVVATGTAVLLLGVVYVYRWLHGIFHRINNPVLMTGIGGVVLGVLGALGGPQTMFKDVEAMESAVTEASGTSVARLMLLGGCSLAAYAVAAASGFRGGRVVSAAVIGVQVGVFAHAVVPALPGPVAVASAVLGAVTVAARSGWLGLFLPAAVVGSVALLPALAVAMIPVWLLVAHRPTMTIRPAHPEPPGVSG